MLDDIGTKCKEPPVEPSWKLESSRGNEQWGYILAMPTDDLELVNGFLRWADENLRRSIMVNEGRYLEMLMRPISIVLLLAVVWPFCYCIRRSPRESVRLTAEGQ